MMTSRNLAIIEDSFDLTQAKAMMHDRRIEKLLIVDKGNLLTGLLTIKDLEQAVLNPSACKDALGRLRVAAASTVGGSGYKRSKMLIEAGVDAIVIDTAHGHSNKVFEAVQQIKDYNSEVDIIAGNVATAEATKAYRACRAARVNSRTSTCYSISDVASSALDLVSAAVGIGPHQEPKGGKVLEKRVHFPELRLVSLVDENRFSARRANRQPVRLDGPFGLE